MAHKRHMRWDRVNKCWRRMLDGVRVVVYARQLGCPQTEEESRDAANQYWESYVAQYYQRRTNPETIARAAIERSFKDFTRTEVIEAYALNREGQDGHRRIDTYLSGQLAPLKQLASLPEQIRNLIGMALVGRDTFERLAGPANRFLPDNVPTHPAKAAKVHVAEWIEDQERLYRTDQISASTYGQYRRMALYWQEWFGPERSITEINEETLKGYFDHLHTLEIARHYRKARHWVFRTMVEGWSERKLIEAPKNWYSKKWRFGSDEVEKDYWTADLFRDEYGKADDFGKLILLLAANMGMYGSDMASVHYHGGET